MHDWSPVCNFSEYLVDRVFGSRSYYVQPADGLHGRTSQEKAVFDLKARSVDDF